MAGDAEGDNGNGRAVNALARSAVRVLLSVLGTLVLAWGAWITDAVLMRERSDAAFRLEIARETGRTIQDAEDAHRRIDGIAESMGCPRPRTTKPDTLKGR